MTAMAFIKCRRDSPRRFSSVPRRARAAGCRSAPRWVLFGPNLIVADAGVLAVALGDDRQFAR